MLPLSRNNLLSQSTAPRCYVDPDAFIPERWFSRPELIKNRNAFAPFSLGRSVTSLGHFPADHRKGPFGCIGRNLALLEIRTVICNLVSRFDVRLAPGEDGTDLLENSMDLFTLMMGQLKVVFEERKPDTEKSSEEMEEKSLA